MEARLDDYTKYHYGACPCCGKPIRPKAGEAIYRDPDLILDNMAGSGTTMLACGLSRNVILVELEEKFCKMAQDNWEKVKMRPQLGSSMGECQIIQGDARQLENILCDKIVTSPPFADTKTYQDFDFMIDTAQDQRERLAKGITKGHNASVEARQRAFKRARKGNIEDPTNIANLSYGQIDKIVASPPYAGDERFGRQFTDASIEGRDKNVAMRYGKQEGQIGNLPYGQIDKIVASPPYEEAMGEKHHSPRADKLAQEKKNPVTYTDRIDSIIASPPYEGSLQGESHDGLKDAEKLEELTKQNPNRKWKRRTELTPGRMQAWGTMGLGYSPNDANIGNLKSDSYLSAMLQVYRQCYKVLKPQGLMILVTKNFIREKKEVRLDLDTIKLCEQAGFSFKERWYRGLPAQSFWRVIYRQKYPDAPELKYEDVLVFVRSII